MASPGYARGGETRHDVYGHADEVRSPLSDNDTLSQSMSSTYSTASANTDTHERNELRLELDLRNERVKELETDYEDLKRRTDFNAGIMQQEIDDLKMQIKQLQEAGKHQTPTKNGIHKEQNEQQPDKTQTPLQDKKATMNELDELRKIAAEIRAEKQTLEPTLKALEKAAAQKTAALDKAHKAHDAEKKALEDKAREHAKAAAEKAAELDKAHDAEKKALEDKMRTVENAFATLSHPPVPSNTQREDSFSAADSAAGDSSVAQSLAELRRLAGDIRAVKEGVEGKRNGDCDDLSAAKVTSAQPDAPSTSSSSSSPSTSVSHSRSRRHGRRGRLSPVPTSGVAPPPPTVGSVPAADEPVAHVSHAAVSAAPTLPTQSSPKSASLPTSAAPHVHERKKRRSCFGCSVM